MNKSRNLISIEGLRKGYREAGQLRPVLRHVDLQVREGQCVALLGRSGSGKSTLLNLLSAIDRPDGGSIRVAGQPIDRLDDRGRTLFRRRNVGFVFQFFNLIPTLTVLENVLLPAELNGVRSASRALELLEQVGLGQRGNSFPDTLSGGEQQRVAIARALVHDPLLVLADEPTGNLDEETGRDIATLLLDTSRLHHKTLLLVTHSRSLAAGADRSLRLSQGRLSEESP